MIVLASVTDDVYAGLFPTEILPATVENRRLMLAKNRMFYKKENQGCFTKIDVLKIFELFTTLILKNICERLFLPIDQEKLTHSFSDFLK